MFSAVAMSFGRDVSFLGVDHLEFRAEGLAFVSRIGVSFPVAHDEGGELAVSLKLAGLPTTIFLDDQGLERNRVTGPITETELRRNIHALLR